MTAAFPGMTFNAKIYHDFLADIDGDFFLKAVEDFVKNTKEIYPGTNLIAMLRDKALSYKTLAQKDHVLKLKKETEEERIERWKRESVPMPEECREQLSKFGFK